MEVVVLLYDGVSAAEALGPHEVLRRLPDSRCRFVAEEPGPQRAHSPPLDLKATHGLDQVDSADVLMVPGGFGCRELLGHEHLLAWIQHVHGTTQWTTAVSTGSVLLAAAGVLAGREATTHWLAGDLLAQFGAIPVPKRVAQSGTIVTAVGPAAAIDMALWLAARTGGRRRADEIRAELAINPDAPFDPDASHEAAAIVRGWRTGVAEPRPTTRRIRALWDLGRRWPPRRVKPTVLEPRTESEDEIWDLDEYVQDLHNE